MNNETKFEIGDKVSWCGKAGIVNDVGHHWICVFFDEIQSPLSSSYNFEKDGRYLSWHTEPSLKLISKAKKKRKVKLYAYVSYNLFRISGAYGSVQYSLSDPEIHDYIRVPELDKEIEIDEP